MWLCAVDFWNWNPNKCSTYKPLLPKVGHAFRVPGRLWTSWNALVSDSWARKQNRKGQMKLLIQFFVAITLLAGVLLRGGETAISSQGLHSDNRLNWWREARFGMFVHWGPASVNGIEISWSRKGHPFDHPGNETVPAEVYDNLYRRFDPEKFDADAWMRLAKEAGMK